MKKLARLSGQKTWLMHLIFASILIANSAAPVLAEANLKVSGVAWTQYQEGMTAMYKGATNFDYNPFFNTGGIIFLGGDPLIFAIYGNDPLAFVPREQLTQLSCLSSYESGERSWLVMLSGLRVAGVDPISQLVLVSSASRPSLGVPFQVPTVLSLSLPDVFEPVLIFILSFFISCSFLVIKTLDSLVCRHQNWHYLDDHYRQDLGFSYSSGLSPE